MNTCVCCGAPLPAEGRQVCLQCENNANSFAPDAILEDGTPLYLKSEQNWSSMQWELYSNLMKYRRAMQEDD